MWTFIFGFSCGHNQPVFSFSFKINLSAFFLLLSYLLNAYMHVYMSLSLPASSLTHTPLIAILLISTHTVTGKHTLTRHTCTHTHNHGHPSLWRTPVLYCDWMSGWPSVATRWPIDFTSQHGPRMFVVVEHPIRHTFTLIQTHTQTLTLVVQSAIQGTR